MLKPPKKKKSGKKGKSSAGSKTPTVIDGVSTKEMSKEQLEEHIMRLREELEREREERNYFQLERDKVNIFWEISKRQLEERSSELRNKSREIEEAEERHQLELKVYKQKVKHLLYEHQNNIAELKAESVVAIKIAQEEHGEKEAQLKYDKRVLKLENKDKQISGEESIRNTVREYEEKLLKTRLDFERELEEIETKHAAKIKKINDDLELRKKMELHETEERKNLQINSLIRSHEKAFSEIKNYYNDITLNNLALINSLKINESYF
ncbi:unnamed protein product [Protopolystoma xenopodis]|uniref:Dynein regulatory complex subunit 4 n=1 Tax=Protopolystoma xenopodis TaxID=117903 RepID=A0A3S5BDA1_9PLAT|nr:unnamed protein product [Protopolystoma xenopodis]